MAFCVSLKTHMNPDPKTLDQSERRCPRLGHAISFGYCRVSGDNRQPCFKVFDCWWEQFDVVSYFRQRLPVDTFNQLSLTSPPNKVASLVDLIQQARNRIQKKE